MYQISRIFVISIQKQFFGINHIEIRINTCYPIFRCRKRLLKMPMTSSEMIKFLKKNGFETVNQNETP